MQRRCGMLAALVLAIALVGGAGDAQVEEEAKLIELADPLLCRPRKRTLLVSEELTLDKFAGNRCATNLGLGSDGGRRRCSDLESRWMAR